MSQLKRMALGHRVIWSLLNNVRLECLRRNDLVVRRNISRLYGVMKKPLPKLLFLCGAVPTLNSAYKTNPVHDNLKKSPLRAHAVQDIVKKADELYMNNDVELYAYLYQFRDVDEAEILWRIARACCDKAKSTPDIEIRKQLMYEAFAYAEAALKLGENNFACHKWYAIMIDYVGEYEGTKERLLKAYEIKNHFLRAIELNDKDATSVHLLGYWCFVFADLSWYQKKLAAILFTSPPTSTYQEALNYFLKAEKVEEGFYSMNQLMIGKAYLRLKQKELAKKYLLKTIAWTPKTEDDKKAIYEATQLLKSM